jgi:GPH family glycoside/pentoside/hexuronide:cation symporter
VVVAETGWPSAGQAVGAAVPSAANAARYLAEFSAWARTNDVEFFYFAGLDEPWKAQFEGPLGAHWGIHDASGALKPGMSAALNCGGGGA